MRIAGNKLANMVACSLLTGTAALPMAAQAQTADAGAQGAVLEEIVVTALRRAQSLSDTPVAISAIKGDDLLTSGVTSAYDLPNILPNVEVGVAGYSIRGVSSGDFTEKGDPSTAFNLDGIYIARFTEQSMALFDLDRVEVLRGPQGTLYGRNATAGVVNVITARPQDKFAAAASLEAGNYNTIRTSAMVNVPIADGAAFRLSGATNRHDGYTKTRDGSRKLDDQEDFALRGRLLVPVGERTEVLLSGDYGKKDDAGVASIAQPRIFSINSDTSQRYQNPGRDDFDRFSAGGGALEVNTDLDFAMLTYLFGYRSSDWKALNTKGDDIAIVMNTQDHEQSSHELRLASTGSGPLQYVLGLYYFDEDTDTSPFLNIGGVGTLTFDLHAKGNSKAGFGQATYSITPAIRVTGGVRYTEDEKSRDGTFQFGTFPSSPYDADYNSNKTTWRASIDADLTDDILAYATVSTGYKAGGFNDGNPQTQPALYYDPEDLTAYEVGVKGTFFDRALYLSLAAFHYDYRGLQLGTVLPAGGQVTANAGKASNDGVELEGTWKIGRLTKFDYSLAYLDAHYDRYLPTGAGGPSWEGFVLDRSPKLTSRISFSQIFELANGASVTGVAAMKYSSSYTVSDFNVPIQYRQKSFTRTDLSVTYDEADGRWFLQAYGRNLENDRQLGVIEFASFSVTDPAQYGVRFGVRF